MATFNLCCAPPPPGGAEEEDINAELGVGSVAADAELDAMKEEVRRRRGLLDGVPGTVDGQGWPAAGAACGSTSFFSPGPLPCF